MKSSSKISIFATVDTPYNIEGSSEIEQGPHTSELN